MRRVNRAGASTRIVEVPSPSIDDAHRAEEPAELDDVRLHGGVANLGPPGGRGRSQQRGLGPGDRRLVQIERRAGQPIRALE